KVGLVDHACVARGPQAIVERFSALQAQGIALAIVDAISNADLMQLGSAVKSLPLVCAGSGLAIGLPANWGFAPSQEAARLPAPAGLKAIVSGSCSQATNAQVASFLHSG